MNITARPAVRKNSLENEVLISVILLYFVISTALLLIHYLQPEDAVTQTSSPSPSHAAFYVGAAPPAAPAAPPLDAAGLRRWLLCVDPRPLIVATPVEPTP
jgi:hypothetical protein